MSKTPAHIVEQLNIMVQTSMDFEDTVYNSLTEEQRKIWNQVAKTIDDTCEMIQKHFNK